jgi:hypothetical protein
MAFSRAMIVSKSACGSFFHGSYESLKPAKSLDPFRLSHLRVFQRTLKKTDGLVVGFQWDRKRMPIFAPMRERKARRIGESGRRSVNDLRDHG